MNQSDLLNYCCAPASGSNNIFGFHSSGAVEIIILITIILIGCSVISCFYECFENYIYSRPRRLRAGHIFADAAPNTKVIGTYTITTEPAV
jgi:hypothetical protein